MPDNDIWPPKPDLPDPLTEYDELIEAKLPTLSAETVKWELVLPRSSTLLPGFLWLMHMTGCLRSRLFPGEPVPERLLLIQALREDRGLDLKQSIAIVNSYCERKGAFLQKKSDIILAFGMVGLLLIMLALVFVWLYLQYMRHVAVNNYHPQTDILALNGAISLVEISYAVVLLLDIFGIAILVRNRRRK